MQRTPEQLRVELERARAQIQASAEALRLEWVSKTDWRQWVRRRPGTCLLAAFAVGYYLGRR